MCAISALHNLFFNNLYSHPSTHIFLRSIHYNMVAHNCRGKTKASQQKQNSFGFATGICFCREVFGFCCEVFCSEGFGFVVRYFVFAVRFFGFAVTVVGHRNYRLGFACSHTPGHTPGHPTTMYYSPYPVKDY